HLEMTSKQAFTTGLDLDQKTGIAHARKQTVVSGARFGLGAVVSADRTSVQLDLEASLARLLSVVGVPVNVSTPLAGEKAIRLGVEVIERPSVVKTHVKRAETLADGESLVLSGGKITVETRTKFPVSILGSIPYLSRFFTVGYGREER